MTAALVAALLTPLPAAAFAATGPVAEWRFDESGGQQALDATGGGAAGILGHTSALESSDPTRVPGVTGRALLFDGDDRVTIPDLTHLEPAHLTVDAWFRRQGSPGAYSYIVSKGGTTCLASSYGLYTGAGGGLEFYISDGASYVLSPAAATAQVWDGFWHHAAGTFDGTSVRLYVDGVQVGAGTRSAAQIRYGLPSRSPFIGTYVGSCERPFAGEIDDVQIWNEALDGTRIAALVHATPPNPAAPATLTGAPGSTPGSTPSRGATPTLPKRCVSVAVAAGKVRVRRKARVVVRVRHAARPLVHARVLFSGAGLQRSVLTARDGRARLTIRPTRKATISIRIKGWTSCDARHLRVRSN